ncbi:MAG: phosphoribosyltransferase family protein [Proteobacteria bacterium]|nr:phosphoribosyltransferase family protein [Pseudomonadota bacterium]MDA1132893.1 phosphoribosyltransferase family protein [Pseudomonadota bacterium]
MSRVIVAYDEETIRRRVAELADEIAAALPGDVLVVAILKGAAIFAADLLREMSRAGMEPEIEFLRLRSYGAGQWSSGDVVAVGAAPDVAGRAVLLVDAILDSGRSLAAARRIVGEGGAASVHACVLVEKPGRAVAVEADFRGFRAGSAFLVGYGTDAAEAHRHLPVLATLLDEPD